MKVSYKSYKFEIRRYGTSYGTRLYQLIWITKKPSYWKSTDDDMFEAENIDDAVEIIKQELR